MRRQELRDVAFDRAAEGFRATAALGCGAFGIVHRGLAHAIGQLGGDHRAGNHLVGAQRGQPMHQVFEFAHVARPAIGGERVDRGLVERLGRPTIDAGAFEEMAGKI